MTVTGCFVLVVHLLVTCVPSLDLSIGVRCSIFSTRRLQHANPRLFSPFLAALLRLPIANHGTSTALPPHMHADPAALGRPMTMGSASISSGKGPGLLLFVSVARCCSVLCSAGRQSPFISSFASVLLLFCWWVRWSDHP